MTSSTALGVETSPQLVASKASGFAALATAASGLAYSVSFLILKDPLLASLFLMLGGLLAVRVLVTLVAEACTADSIAFLVPVGHYAALSAKVERLPRRGSQDRDRLGRTSCVPSLSLDRDC
jgi:hypothetical protein